ncbi:hypothetical protein JTB14_030049 [Gonioctena quinquepunctata]|nr:hypothetical protein JTB14_030049 [Gonioctena quinquepunctata]
MGEKMFESDNFFSDEIIPKPIWGNFMKNTYPVLSGSKFVSVNIQPTTPLFILEATIDLQDKILKAVDIVNGSVEFAVPIIMLSCLLHLIVTPYFLLIKISSTCLPLL